MIVDNIESNRLKIDYNCDVPKIGENISYKI